MYFLCFDATIKLVK